MYVYIVPNFNSTLPSRPGSTLTYPRRCKSSLVGQSLGLSVPRSPV